MTFGARARARFSQRSLKMSQKQIYGAPFWGHYLSLTVLIIHAFPSVSFLSPLPVMDYWNRKITSGKRAQERYQNVRFVLTAVCSETGSRASIICIWCARAVHERLCHPSAIYPPTTPQFEWDWYSAQAAVPLIRNRSSIWSQMESAVVGEKEIDRVRGRGGGGGGD